MSPVRADDGPLRPLQRMSTALDRREALGMLRRLKASSDGVADFASNDYLGLASSSDFHRVVAKRVKETQEEGTFRTGSTGSRLLSGHSHLTRTLEEEACKFHSAKSALLFNSGYDANLSVFSCVPDTTDYIVYDELVHASIHDGMRLGRARDSIVSFPHNCMDGLRTALSKVLSHLSSISSQAESNGLDSRSRANTTSRTIYVAAESVYSMDGDIPALGEMLDIAQEMSCEQATVVVVLDEAHGVGIAGPQGEGVAVAQNVTAHPHLLARVVTYGKAFGAHGAMVLCDEVMREYLVNYARPLIYSTAMPPHSVATLLAAYEYMRTEKADAARRKLTSNQQLFRSEADARLPGGCLMEPGEHSPIQSVLVPGNERCLRVASSLVDKGYSVYPIRAPTVPKGTERIRVVLHAHNTTEEILGLVLELDNAIRKVRALCDKTRPRM